MKTFEYRGFNVSGRTTSGLIEALTIKEAREKLTERGILPESVESAGQRRFATGFQRGIRFDLESRATLYRELSVLLKAGLPLAQAFQILIQSPDESRDTDMLAGIRDRIREGVAPDEAFGGASERVTVFEKAVIKVGERAGTLDVVLGELADYLDGQAKLRENLKSALIYPCIVLVLAVGVALAMVGFIIPSVAKLFQESHIALPPLTRILIFTMPWVIKIGVLILIVAAVALWIGWRRIKSQSKEEKWNAYLFRLPLLGRAYQLLVNIRFASIMSLLLKGGVPLVEGLDLAAAATGSSYVKSLLEREAQSVREGKSLANAIQNVPPLSGSLSGWIQAGEASGQLANLLDVAAARYRHTWENYVTRLLNALEPLLIIVVGLFVLFIALAVLLPILSLNQTMM